MKLFSNLWHGRVRLWKIFWLGWVGIGLALPITFTLLASAHLKPSVDAALGKSFGQPQANNAIEPVLTNAVIWVSLPAVIASIVIVMAVFVWRNARNTDWKICFYLARICVVLFALKCALIMFEVLTKNRSHTGPAPQAQDLQIDQISTENAYATLMEHSTSCYNTLFLYAKDHKADPVLYVKNNEKWINECTLKKSCDALFEKHKSGEVGAREECLKSLRKVM